MNRLGIESLNAGAPDLRLTGDQTQRGGTYTQRRRNQMAGGGIMGSNSGSMLVAPTADGSRPGYGRWDDPGMSPGTSSSYGGGVGGGGGQDYVPVASTPTSYNPDLNPNAQAVVDAAVAQAEANEALNTDLVSPIADNSAVT